MLIPEVCRVLYCRSVCVVCQRHEHSAALMCFYCLHIVKDVTDYVKHVQVSDALARNRLCVTLQFMRQLTINKGCDNYVAC